LYRRSSAPSSGAGEYRGNLTRSRGSAVARLVDMIRRRKNPHAMALGRLGGLKGGRARAEKLTAQRRREIARRAALTRWHGEHA